MDYECRYFWEEKPLPVLELIFTEETEITYIVLVK